MADQKEIASELWAMANKLRGSMDASEYKNYILAFMFYRYLSEHQEEYLKNDNVIDIVEGQTVNEAYLEQANNDDLEDYLEDISSSLGYAIAPLDTWASLIHKIDNSMVIPSDYQAIFDNFNKNAERNKEAVQDFRGVFDDVNLGDSRLGSSTNERAKALNGIVKLVDKFDYKSDDGTDILGAVYEYLIGQFAASAGKKGSFQNRYARQRAFEHVLQCIRPNNGIWFASSYRWKRITRRSTNQILRTRTQYYNV